MFDTGISRFLNLGEQKVLELGWVGCRAAQHGAGQGCTTRAGLNNTVQGCTTQAGLHNAVQGCTTWCRAGSL